MRRVRRPPRVFKVCRGKKKKEIKNIWSGGCACVRSRRGRRASHTRRRRRRRGVHVYYYFLCSRPRYTGGGTRRCRFACRRRAVRDVPIPTGRRLCVGFIVRFFIYLFFSFSVRPRSFAFHRAMYSDDPNIPPHCRGFRLGGVSSL